MANFPVSHTIPTMLGRIATIRNGIEPDARTARMIADGINFVFARCRKVPLMYSFQRPQSTGFPADGSSENSLRFYFLSGYYGGETAVSLMLRATMLVAHSTTLGAGSTPRARLVVYDGTTTTNGTWARYPKGIMVANYYLDQMFELTSEVAISENTYYQCYIEFEDRFPLESICVYEVATDSVRSGHSYTADIREFTEGEDITYEQLRDLTWSTQELFERNGAHCFSYTTISPYNTRTASTFVNMLNAGVTTYDANSKGFGLQLQYHNPLHKTTVPARLAVYGYNDSGTTGEVKLVDAGGDVTGASITSFNATPAWRTADFELNGGAADVRKVDIHWKSNGTNTLTVQAVCLLEVV